MNSATIGSNIMHFWFTDSNYGHLTLLHARYESSQRETDLATTIAFRVSPEVFKICERLKSTP